MSATGEAIRALYSLRVEVARQDERLRDVGTRLEGVLSCEAIVEDAAAALDLLGKRVVVAERECIEAVTELKSTRFRHEQTARCAGCGERKHTPLRIDAMGGYVCMTCIDRRLCDLLAKEQVSKGGATPFIAPGGYVEQAYRAGFEASNRDFNFETLGPAYAGNAEFELLLARDFELVLEDFEA